MMQLLSPAGSREALAAAVQNGADAVYFGGGSFNARRFAANFDDDDMQRAIDYCHERGVKVNITLNTLILDREMPSAVKYAEFLCKAGADCAIVQDMGLVSLIKKYVPELPLHASTQMGIHTLDGVRLAEELGMKQVVLSREVPLSEIEYIHGNSSVALEAFAHGALCMSFSGGCLLSSMAGERSGNRGTCAQPCRKRMGLDKAPEREEYCLSLGDLCMIEHLGEMERVGISCIKLEGRMKRAEYVAVVTAAYRAALDGANEKEIALHKRRMLDMFDRGGGSTGYFYGNNAKTGCVAVSNRSKPLIDEATRSFSSERRKQGVNIELVMHTGSPAMLTLCLGKLTAEAEGEVVQPAHRPQPAARYIQQAEKLGDTPFVSAGASADIDEDAFLPMSAVNAMRREAAEKLAELLHTRRKCGGADVPRLNNLPSERMKITAIVGTARQARAAFEAGADEVALEPVCYDIAAFEAAAAAKGGGKLLISLPAAIINHNESEKIRRIAASGILDGGIAANIGQLALIRHLPLKIAGTQLNAMNAHTVAEYRALGFDRVTLSLELTKPQLRDICGQHTAVSVYGRAQLMQLHHCPVKEYKGCQGCGGFPGSMTDEAGRVFPLCNIRQEGGCLVRLLNCLPTDVIDLFNGLPRPEAVQLCFYTESPDEVAERVAAAKGAAEGEKTAHADGITRGHWSRAVD